MKKVRIRVPSLAKKYPRVVATPCKDHNLPPEAEELAKKIEDKLSQMTAMALKSMIKPGSTLGTLEIEVEQLIRELKIRVSRTVTEEEDNPWAICTASVGRKDKEKYERCVLSVKNKKK